MPLLHPDKLVGVTRAIHSRPTMPKPSLEVAAARTAAGPKKLKVGKPTVKAEPGLLENLAYQLQAQHEERHLNRLARRVDSAVKPKAAASSSPAPAKPQAAGAPIEIHVRPIDAGAAILQGRPVKPS